MLEVVHRLHEPWVNVPSPMSVGIKDSVRAPLENRLEIGTTAFANQIGVVSWWTDTDRPGRASERVA
jgi:hypothetical protein